MSITETPKSVLSAAISDLREGANRLSSMQPAELKTLVDQCAENLPHVAIDWVTASCEAKGISANAPIAAEEILAGPAALLRYLRLLSEQFQNAAAQNDPRLPSAPFRNSTGWLCAPILPVKSLFDRYVFLGLKAEVWFANDIDEKTLFAEPFWKSGSAGVAGILGAGNVSSIPATDMLFKIFQEGEAVLLKFNPVNEYLAPIFEVLFQPLIRANLLRITLGGAEIGEELVQHDGIDSIHITGSQLTHDAIVWGADSASAEERQRANAPLITKPITSELGNVTPWIIVPGQYTKRQLRAQAEHLVTSIVNNCSFNCLATKMIITSKNWSQRIEFLDLVASLLKSVPERHAYYPGANERFAAATGKPAPDSQTSTLPWTLIRDAKLADSPHLFREESFVCVCAETALDEQSAASFLDAAVDFANEHLFGTLCATITIPNSFLRNHKKQLNAAIARMRYGSVCINQWSGVMYGLMSPPWGGHNSSTLMSPESGIGHVHNSFNLKGFDKTVLWGPLVNLPKPAWFYSHKNGHRTAWALIKFYERPSWKRLLPLFFQALRG